MRKLLCLYIGLLFSVSALSASMPDKGRFGEFDPDWTIYSTRGVSSLVASVSNAIPDVSQFVTESVTNGLASTNWVLGIGYVGESVTNGLASTNWVLGIGYVGESITNGLASTNWVLSKGYVTESVTNGLSGVSFVTDSIDQAKAWVQQQGYVFESVTNGLASMDWVLSQDFMDESVTNGLASMAWVEDRGYATEDWVGGRGYATESWVNGKGYATESWVNDRGYATEDWVGNRGYATENWVYDLDYATEQFVIDLIASSGGGGSPIIDGHLSIAGMDPYISLVTTNRAGSRSMLSIYPTSTAYQNSDGGSFTLGMKELGDSSVSLEYPLYGGTLTTEGWVLDKISVLDPSVLDNLATKAWVGGQDYVSRWWLDSKSYVTEPWVLGKGYATTNFVEDAVGSISLVENDPTVGITNNTIYVHGQQLTSLMLGENNSLTIGSRNSSVAVGQNSLVLGNNSSLEASMPAASGRGSIAIGSYARASGTASLAIGGTANGGCSATVGNGTAGAMYSLAVGNLVETGGEHSSAAFGALSRATGTGSLAFGYDSRANSSFSVAGGYKSSVNSSDGYAFSWSGDNHIGRYYSHGTGTFNINPLGGLSGFYVGATNLADHIEAISIKTLGDISLDGHSVDLNGYATKTWVDNRGFMTGHGVEEYVDSKGYVSTNQLFGYGYATLSDLYATNADTRVWVADQGYVTKDITNGLASASWVDSGYATKDYVYDSIMAASGMLVDDDKLVLSGISPFVRLVATNPPVSDVSFDIGGITVNNARYGYPDVPGVIATKEWIIGSDYATKPWIASRYYIQRSGEEEGIWMDGVHIAPIFRSETNNFVSLSTPGLSGGAFAVSEGVEANASGYASHAEGTSTTASGPNSHAGGLNSVASGSHSYAEGEGSSSVGRASHAEGFQTTSSGRASHAEGIGSSANYEATHAEGYYTEAIGGNSHAEGFRSVASGVNSHAEGRYTKTAGEGSHAEGFATKSEGLYSHAEGDTTTASSPSSHAEGAKTRATGPFSHSEGTNTVASALAAHAEGSMSRATGRASHSEGSSTASGSHSHAEGGSNAGGLRSHAEGNSTAVGESSHAENVSVADGQYSHSEGYYSVAGGSFSHSEGGSSYAVGSGSHSEGTSVFTFGDDITWERIMEEGEEEGRPGNQYYGASGTVAEGDGSHAEGVSSWAKGAASHAEGYHTRASGYASHSQGVNTKALGDFSFAGGTNSIAHGDNSFAFGWGAEAVDYGSVAFNGRSTGYGSIAINGNADPGFLAIGGDATGYGSMIIGSGVASGKGSVGLGPAVYPVHRGSFVWNRYSIDDWHETEPYYSHGEHTFNINPAGGVAGVYIGETPLSESIATEVRHQIGEITIEGTNVDFGAIATTNWVNSRNFADQSTIYSTIERQMNNTYIPRFNDIYVKSNWLDRQNYVKYDEAVSIADGEIRQEKYHLNEIIEKYLYFDEYTDPETGDVIPMGYHEPESFSDLVAYAMIVPDSIWEWWSRDFLNWDYDDYKKYAQTNLMYKITDELLQYGVASTNWVIGQGVQIDVEASLTNGLASQDWVLGRGYALYDDEFTNSVSAIASPMTNGLASMSWSRGQFLTPAATNSVSLSLRNWVDSKGYASEDWVLGKDYAPKSWVTGLGYATRNWVARQGYLTSVDMNNFATKDWVSSRGYVGESVTNGLASKAWVNGKGYATESWVNGKGYATEDWVMTHMPTNQSGGVISTPSSITLVVTNSAGTVVSQCVVSTDSTAYHTPNGKVLVLSLPADPLSSNVTVRLPSVGGTLVTEGYIESLGYVKRQDIRNALQSVGTSFSSAEDVRQGLIDLIEALNSL